MTILYKRPGSLVGSGAFADVFDAGGNSVVKLFRRMAVTHQKVEDPSDHDVVVRATWDAEAKAYELAAPRAALTRHLAPWLGRVSVPDVFDANNQSIADQYLLDCGYSIAKIPGRDCKIGALMGVHPLFEEIDAYVDELIEAGIKAPGDGSVFIPGLANGFTLIDIAVWEAMADLSIELANVGRLSAAARNTWGAK